MMRKAVNTTLALALLLSGCASLGIQGSGGPITTRFEKLAFYTGKAAQSVEQAYVCLSDVAGLQDKKADLERRLEASQTNEEKQAIEAELKQLKEDAKKAAELAAAEKRQLSDAQRQLVKQTCINLAKAGEYYAQYIANEAPALVAEVQNIMASQGNPSVALKYSADLPRLPEILANTQTIVANTAEQPVVIAAMLKPLTELALANGVELPSKEEVASEVKKELASGLK